MAIRSKTWWGREFLSALEKHMDPARLTRGRSYAGPDRIEKFEISGSRISAIVIGNINPYFGVYKTPKYKVSVNLTPITTKQWITVLKRLGVNANWVTHLVLGVMPPTIEKALEGSSASLLPRGGNDIHSVCSCPDWANPCKHVAGVYYCVAKMIDQDPFLLFELRGLQRKKLFEAMRKFQFGTALVNEIDQQESDLEEALLRSTFRAVESRKENAEPMDQREFWLGGTLPHRSESEAPPVTVLPMRRAGDYPSFWSSHHSFLDTMGDTYTRIAKGLPASKKTMPGLMDS